MMILLIFFLGFLDGILLYASIDIIKRYKNNNKKSVGLLQIIETPDEEPYLFLSLYTSIASVINESNVIIDVQTKKVSHK